ncbi:hypothetical protein GW17_00055843 [Ensete ventricosum]|nr:hypothetical protein GW17_00055843 [Ensete ventricosum]
MRTARYRAVPPKIDRQQSISAVDGRLSEKKGGRRKRGKRRKKKRRKKTYRPRAVLALALSPLARRRRPRVDSARASSSPAGRQRPRAVAARGSRALFLPRGEKDQGSVASTTT